VSVKPTTWPALPDVWERPGVLSVARLTPYVPGINVKGEVTGANWTYLLPHLEPEHVAVLGIPPPAVLSPLMRLAKRVTLLCVPRRAPKRGADVGRLRLQYRSYPLHIAFLETWRRLPLASQSVDLLVLDDGELRARFTRHEAWPHEVRRVLKPTGLLYFQAGPRSTALVERLRHHAGTLRRFWITPLVWEMKTAVPERDPAAEAFLVRRGLYATGARRPPLSWFEGFLYRHGRLRARARRMSVLWTPDEEPVPHALPRYLRELAATSGLDLTAHRWALVAKGEYSSRKVLFYVFPPDEGDRPAHPAYLIKLTRDPRHNYRLENEVRALQALRRVPFQGAEVLPRVLFAGHHGGLAVAGQTAVRGRPFDRCTLATPDCPHARAATKWLVELGRATVNREEATSADVARALRLLLCQLAEVYRLSPDHHRFLERQLERLAGDERPFPLVFQHGDPGPWNVLVRPDGLPVFLDWESAEPLGMPLWDLWYFWRSYSLRVARARGTRRRLRAFSQQFLAGSELSIRIVASVRHYREQVGLPCEWTAPLFYMCWVHRALKEATRLRPQLVERGHYINLLRLCIDRREMPTLRRMFGERRGT